MTGDNEEAVDAENVSPATHLFFLLCVALCVAFALVGLYLTYVGWTWSAWPREKSSRPAR